MIRLVLGMRKMDRSLDQPSRNQLLLSDHDPLSDGERFAAKPDLNDPVGNDPIGAAAVDDPPAVLTPVRCELATGRPPTLRDAATR
jgi:hypothetical protein